MLIIGKLDLLPRASIIPIGKAKAIPTTPNTKVTSKPPHLLVGTTSKPNPPYNKMNAIIGKINVNFKKCFLKGKLSNNFRKLS